MFKGLTKQLETPKHLLGKLQFDFERIKADPLDVYAAFDFFVTAEHIPDWIGDLPIKEDFPLLKVISHIANGAKHFEATAKKHKSVENVHLRDGVFSPKVFNPEAFAVGDLIIEIKGEEVKQFGAEISVRKLAQMVVEFWTEKLLQE